MSRMQEVAPVNSHSDAETIREWLESVVKITGLKPTPLAKEAGLAPSTLLRAMDAENPTALERRSILKIVERFNVPPPYGQSAGLPTYPPGFSESELLQLEDDVPFFDGLALTPNQYVRTVNTRALELAGYLPGDLVLFDMSAQARAGDVVSANVYNLQRGSAETVLRVYEQPYIIARTMDAAIAAKPHLVDDERVKIMAVAIKAMRRRK